MFEYIFFKLIINKLRFFKGLRSQYLWALAVLTVKFSAPLRGQQYLSRFFSTTHHLVKAYFVVIFISRFSILDAHLLSEIQNWSARINQQTISQRKTIFDLHSRLYSSKTGTQMIMVRSFSNLRISGFREKVPVSEE